MKHLYWKNQHYNIENLHQKDETNLAEEGNSIIYVVQNKQIIALIGVNDILRENTKQVIENRLKIYSEHLSLQTEILEYIVNSNRIQQSNEKDHIAIELQPQNPQIRKLQHDLVEQYGLQSTPIGEGESRHLRVSK